MINKVLEVARSQIGIKEMPSGSNQSKYNRWYGMNNAPWCAMFVSWCFDTAGYPLPIIQDKAPSGGAYCPFFEQYARKNNQWFSTPEVGDLVLFHFGNKLAVHIGIVERIINNNIFVCIEGNTSVTSNDNGGSVMRRTRYINQCRGFFRPSISNKKEDFYRLIKVENPLMYGEDVKKWQKQMSYFSEYKNLEIDGYYGQKSETICKDFQGKRGLEIDGIIGEKTWAESFRKLS
jgi:hypothetical protein